jgi:hypothetical protein
MLRRILAFLAVSLLPATVVAAATPPALPRVFVHTGDIAPTGKTIVVAAGGNLQAALDSSEPGDVITLQAGAVFTGPFSLPIKKGSGWITVRTSAPDSSLPPAGVRMTPAFSSLLPKIVTPNSGPALKTTAGAHHFRFIGLELTLAPGVMSAYSLIDLGNGGSSQTSLSQVPHDLIFDRVYAHGHAAAHLRRAFTLNSASTAIINSYISDVHQVGFDTQAIGGWNGPGPFKIVNNYLEAAGENIMFGGGDPTIDQLVPSDIEIRGNHFDKPLTWMIGNPAYAGTPWGVKNLFELKNAQRVLIVGNVFEHNWPHAQNGFAILFTVRNQDGSAPWSVVRDVTFTHNVVRHVAAGINIHNTDNNHPSQPTERILIQHNLFYNVGTPPWGGSGIFVQMSDGPVDVAITHNTVLQNGHIVATGGTPPARRFVFTNNIVPHNQYGVGGDNTYGNPNLTLRTYFPDGTFRDNAIVGGNPASYPSGNHFPASVAAVGFANVANGDYRLSDPRRAGGSDAVEIGANVDVVEMAARGAIAGTTHPGGRHAGLSTDIPSP